MAEPNRGSVNAITVTASDRMVVHAARVSLGKDLNEFIDREHVEGLIKFLMKNKHGTPFEHNLFTFLIECPLFVAREWQRHRIGSFNEMSGRYTKLPASFHRPNLVEMRTQVGKPGHYSFEPIAENDAESMRAMMETATNSAFAIYEALLDQGLAKEVARQILPLNTMTKFYWSVNARSLMNFLSLRTDSTAMKEIRDLAEEVQDFFEEYMPFTYKAWIDNGKVAP